MAKIIINDILDELREENNRLFNENKRINELLDNYRKCLLLIKNKLNDLQNVCKCSENSRNQMIIDYTKTAANLYIKTPFNQKPNYGNKSSLEDMNTTQEFTHSKGKFNQLIDNYQRKLEMNGKSSSNPPKSSPNLTLTEYQLRNKRKAELGVSLDGKHPFKEGSKDRSSDKSSDNNFNYKISVKFCMYCKKSLYGIPRREKGKCDEGWYHKKCRPTELNPRRLQTLKNKLWLKMNNRFDSIGAEGTEHISDEQNENKDSNELNSGLDLESINNYKEELTIESKNVSSSCGKVRTYRHVCAHEGCGRSFSHTPALIYHIRTQHTFEKPFKCQECDERFYTKEKLKTHLSIHLCERNPELRVKCDFKDCEKYFYTQYSMRKHKKMKHSIERWTCDWPECGRVLNFKTRLRRSYKTTFGAQTVSVQL